jgi:polyisoprenoid-binding protein YceI
MSIRTLSFVLATLAVAGSGGGARGDEYAVDPAHSAVVFRASHLSLSWIYGRFKGLSGTFAVDAQSPAETHFELSAQAGSVDTDNAQRDQHLKSPDFFNSKQFPAITFKSTAVKPFEGGYEVAGDLTLHGVTRPLTILLKGGRTAEFPRGVQRTGYVGEFTIKRSEFGMDKMLGAVGDDILVHLSFEGTKQ